MGLIIEEGLDIESTKRVMLGNRESVHQLSVTPGRILQILSFLDFAIDHLAKICRPHTYQAVLSSIMSQFFHALSAAGLTQLQQPA